MDIEKEIFKKSEIIDEKLISFGFTKEKDKYKISKNILNNTFRIDIEIENKNITGKIYDLSFNEEYINHKIESQNGEFVNKIREEYKNFLIAIKRSCTNTKYFISSQANRLVESIIKKYNDYPEFIFKTSKDIGVFRNPKNGKWYALIMKINKNKLDNQNKEVEILNIKLDKDEILKLLKRKGFYKAYHMNKKHWITIVLDDTIKDKEIINYIIENYKFTEKK